MMRFWFRFPDGTEVLLTQKPVRMKLTRQSGTPANMLEVVFSAAAALFSAEPCAVRAELDGAEIFAGIVDEHAVRLERGGRQEGFSCRSMAALLLDSEAMPGTLEMPSLRVMEKLYLAPFGLRAAGGDFVPKRGQLVIEAGMTCWEVLCAFAERFLGCTPYCAGDTVYFGTREPGKITLPQLKSLEVVRCAREQLSRVVVQSAQTGAYSAVYENAAAPVARVRYLSARSEISPTALFAEGERNALRVEAVCAGYVDTRPGDIVESTEYEDALCGLRVVNMVFAAENGVSETRLTLERDG